MPAGGMQIHTSTDFVLPLQIQLNSLVSEFPGFLYCFLF